MEKKEREELLKKLREQMEMKKIKRRRNATAKNACKDDRAVSFHWSHFENQAYRTVGKMDFGGYRYVSVSKDCTKRELMQEAIKLFFENGISTKGAEADCIFEMSLDAKGRKVLDNEKETVEELMSRTKIRNPRFYLLSKLRSDGESDDDDLTLPVMSQPVRNEKCEKKTKNSEACSTSIIGVGCRSAQQAVSMSTSTQDNMAQFLLIEGVDCTEQLNAETQLMVQGVQLLDTPLLNDLPLENELPAVDSEVMPGLPAPGTSEGTYFEVEVCDFVIVIKILVIFYQNKLWSIPIFTSEFKISYFKNDQYEKAYYK